MKEISIYDSDYELISEVLKEKDVSPEDLIAGILEYLNNNDLDFIIENYT